MKNSFVLYTKYAEHIGMLTDEQCGVLFRAILAYERVEELPQMDSTVCMAFSFIRQDLDAAAEKYDAVVEARRKAGTASAEARKNKAEQTATNSTCVNSAEQKGTNSTVYDNDNDNVYVLKEKSKPKEKAPAAPRFVKPTVQDIRAYCLERQNSVDPQTFYDFYESKGWMVGKSPMKDWKATVRTWESRRKEEARAPAKRNQFNDNFDARKYDFDDLETQLLRAQGR